MKSATTNVIDINSVITVTIKDLLKFAQIGQLSNNQSALIVCLNSHFINLSLYDMEYKIYIQYNHNRIWHLAGIKYNLNYFKKCYI